MTTDLFPVLLPLSGGAGLDGPGGGVERGGRSSVRARLTLHADGVPAMGGYVRVGPTGEDE